MPYPVAVAQVGYDTVWVYPDRKVGLRTLARPPVESYKFLIEKPLSSKWVDDAAAVMFQPYTYEEFFKIGAMFDRRPIYAQTGRIEVAVCRGFATKEHQGNLDELNRSNTRRLCKQKFGPGYIELDERFGDGVQHEVDLKATRSVYREARLLVYV